jgi:hypothetical protein
MDNYKQKSSGGRNVKSKATNQACDKESDSILQTNTTNRHPATDSRNSEAYTGTTPSFLPKPARKQLQAQLITKLHQRKMEHPPDEIVGLETITAEKNMP